MTAVQVKRRLTGALTVCLCGRFTVLYFHPQDGGPVPGPRSQFVTVSESRELT